MRWRNAFAKSREEHDIPIVEDPPLARALFATADIDRADSAGTLRGGGEGDRLRHAAGRRSAPATQASGAGTDFPESADMSRGRIGVNDRHDRYAAQQNSNHRASGGRLDPLQSLFWVAVAVGVAAAGVAITAGPTVGQAGAVLLVCWRRRAWCFSVWMSRGAGKHRRVPERGAMRQRRSLASAAPNSR